ncbi:MAG: 50S ribosomal protein L24 [Bifidobacteriaceae bacterium]|jgi:large subunit ribosomal protein L24|nr:50S ribosomal protein L24 [Bifidobacteriaceae bacterium]
MAKIRTNDRVLVITGKDKGKEGRVLEVLTNRSRIIVEGIQRAKKHNKPKQTDRGSKTGGIETIENSIHISNVKLLATASKKSATRVGYRLMSENQNGRSRLKRVRISKKTGKDIE